MGEADGKIGIKFWGVRGSTPCANTENMHYGGNTTCFQVLLPGTNDYLIIDSGTGIRNLGNEIENMVKNIKAHIFLTHPHWDHIQGFPFFKPIYQSGNKISVHLPLQKDGNCRKILSGHMIKTYFPVTPEMLAADIDYVTQEFGRKAYSGFDVEFMLANHPTNTAVYKIHAGGREIIFCPDNELQPVADRANTAFYEQLKKFFNGADVLIHDGQYSRESYKERKNWGHSAWEEVVEFARKCNIKQLYLTHHDPDSDDPYLSEVDHAIRETYVQDFDRIQLARESEFIHI